MSKSLKKSIFVFWGIPELVAKADLVKLQFEKFRFTLSFSIIYIYYILRYPELSYSSEVWSEQGHNYLYHAYYTSFWENIWLTDFGYLVWLPRFIALIVSSLFSPYLFIFVTNFIGLAMISFGVSFINHKAFRVLILSDSARFILSLLLGILIFSIDYINLTYINFSYIGFFFCSLIIFLDKSKLSKAMFCTYSILSALLCISKFHFVIFFPIFLIITVWHIIKKNLNTSLFFIPSLCTISIHIVFILFISSSNPSVISHTAFHRFDAILVSPIKGLLFWIQSYGINFTFFNEPIYMNTAGILSISTILIFSLNQYIKKIINSTTFLSIIIFNTLAIMFLTASSLCEPFLLINPEIRSMNFRFSRSGLTAYILSWVSVYILLFSIKKRYVKTILISIFVLMTINIFKEKRKMKTEFRTGSDWRNYGRLTEQKRFLIPVDPVRGHPPWVINKGTQLLKMHKNINGVIKTNSNINIVSILLDYNKKEYIYAEIYNKGEKIKTKAMLSSIDIPLKYITFGSEGISADIIIFKNRNNRKIKIKKLTLYGYKK